MIIRPEHFVPRSATDDDPLRSTYTEEDMKLLAALGADELNWFADTLDLEDECFKCGEKLRTPFVYWHGANRGVSLHPHCAAQLALGLTKDAFESAKGKRPETGWEAAAWLDVYAQKKEYGLEDEEIPKQV